ncbi:MAG: T9SS type A sorting domain-containing protein [Saprospiraceae bacterium]|nr:T9SS type A sorting domain-containing protein [Saprospiraceae bacterium]MDW8484029.1 T9SS type A sorting domain-containing protein [Saprospiraceae bacterium]
MRITILIALFAALASALSGQIFYLQSFNSHGPAFPPGWTPSDSRVVVNNQSQSSGYNPPPASGSYNVRMDDCNPTGETVRVTVSGVISTVGRTNIRVGFGRRRSNAHNTPVSLEWSSDGVNWNTISSDVADGATTTWSAVSYDLPSSAENVSNLRFRFSYVTQVNMNCTTPPNFRIDDFAVGENFSLPLELLQFEARYTGKSTYLHWSTATEYNSAYFEVERGGPGARFEAIGRVQAAGYAVEPNRYEFNDLSPLPGVNYYRLRMTDTDGSFSYSPIQEVYVPKVAGEVHLLPSPARDFLRVTSSMFAEDIEIRWQIVDLFGRLWQQGSVAGSGSLEIPTYDLPAGSYLFQCISAGKQTSYLFVKQ